MATSQEFVVKRSEPEMIGIGVGIGLKGSQNLEKLYLSELDQCYPFHLPLLSFYSKNVDPDPAEVLREALKRTLVYYYPLAGRLKEVAGGQGRLEVVCNGEGVMFAEAQASCSLEDIIPFKDNNNDFVVHSPSLLLLHIDQALPLHQTPLLTFQVTRFTCGGFVVGILFSHAMMDGGGYSQFMKALAEISRLINAGGNQDIVLAHPPIWERELLDPARFCDIEKPLKTVKPLNTVVGIDEEQSSWSFFVGRGELDGMKQEFRCSAFQALTAFVWTMYAKCVDFPLPGLSFTMNARHLIFNTDLASRYYGNCVVQVQVTRDDLLHEIETEFIITPRKKTLENLKGMKDVETRDVLSAIGRAKERVDITYLRSHILSLSRRDHGNEEEEVVVNAGILHFVDQTKVCYLPDLGMGKAAHAVMPTRFPSIIFLPTPTDTIRVDATMGTSKMTIFKSLISESLKAPKE